MPVKLADKQFTDPHTKVNILFQAHFSRTQLPPDLELDAREVVTRSIPLVQACVDVIASNGWLTPALGAPLVSYLIVCFIVVLGSWLVVSCAHYVLFHSAAMELSQMIVQAVWDSDSPLRQIPHFSPEVVKRCKDAGVEGVFDLMELEDSDRNKLIPFEARELRDVVSFCNQYPNIELTYDVENRNALSTGEAATVRVSLQRDGDARPAFAPFFAQKKDESWWIVLGDPSTNALLANKVLFFFVACCSHISTSALDAAADGSGQVGLCATAGRQRDVQALLYV